MEESKSKDLDPTTKYVELFIKLVNGVGFPIVACAGLFYLLYTFQKDVLVQLKAINNNLISLNKVVSKHEAEISNLKGLSYNKGDLIDKRDIKPYNVVTKPNKNKEELLAWQEKQQKK